MNARKQQNLRLLLILPIALLSLATFAKSENFDLGGFAEIDKRLLISDGVSNGDTFGKLRVEGKYEISENIFSFVSTEVRYYDFPLLEDLPEVGKIESNYPVDVLLWEAYLELNPFIWEDLDVKIGKQRIAWGTADKFNPTDNLNSNDLTDFFDFEAKVPSLALKASYYLEDFTITGVWLPFFEPALFPRGGTAFFFNLEPNSVEVPDKTLQNSMFALKLSGTAFNLDYSLSYFKGFDAIPIPLKLDQASGLVLGYPEIQALGFDFAGELSSVGFWGEMALFFSEEIKMGPRVLLSDEPYLKYTIGADYTFKNGIYWQIQYVHGFFTERGNGNLNNFLFSTIAKNFFNDELKLELRGGAEAEDIDTHEGSYGFAVVPEISYRPVDNLELTLGAYLFWGKGDTFFERLKDENQLYFETKFSF